MSKLLRETEDFRAYQANLGRNGRPHAATASLSTKVRVFTPATGDPQLRWDLTKFLMRILWSSNAVESMKVGALFGIISMYAERPGNLIRSLLNDSDITVIIIDVNEMRDGIPVLERRGETHEEEMDILQRIVHAPPNGTRNGNLFADENVENIMINDTGFLLTALTTIISQIWILLAKAVTAPDTADESEQRRWQKLIQQKRVDPFFTVSHIWINDVRDLISSNLSARKMMVEMMIEARKAGSGKGRLTELIGDIATYVEETGLAGFFTTIRYGIETKYSALALNEFQADLITIQGLMRLYKDMGERAPFMVLTEDSAQARFAAGNYPLLWSFAMGVGMTLDKALVGLNINRSYLEPGYFRLGQKLARHHAGSIDEEMAIALKLTQDQKDNLAQIVQESTNAKTENIMQNREAKFATTSDVLGQPNNQDNRAVTAGDIYEMMARKRAKDNQDDQSIKSWQSNTRSTQISRHQVTADVHAEHSGSNTQKPPQASDDVRAAMAALHEKLGLRRTRINPKDQSDKNTASGNNDMNFIE